MKAKIFEFLPSTMLALLLAFGAACPQPLPPVPPGPIPVPAIDAGASDTNAIPAVRAACLNLARLGCPEGLRVDCELVAQKAVDLGTTNLALECLAAARSVAEVQDCGSVACR